MEKESVQENQVSSNDGVDKSQTPTISIDMDRACDHCGKSGAIPTTGLCIGCAGNEVSKHLLGGGEFPIPTKEEFEGKQFLQSDDLKAVAESLIDKYESDVSHLEYANIVYLWKAAGGESNGYATLGKCIRPSGLAAFFAAPDPDSNVDYVIWCAADHLRDNRAKYRTVCALIFHELKHTAMQHDGN